MRIDRYTDQGIIFTEQAREDAESRPPGGMAALERSGRGAPHFYTRISSRSMLGAVQGRLAQTDVVRQ